MPSIVKAASLAILVILLALQFREATLPALTQEQQQQGLRLSGVFGALTQELQQQGLRLSEVAGTLSEIADTLSEVAGALVLPRLRRALERCTEDAAVFVLTGSPDKPFLQCTAVPMPRELLAQARNAADAAAAPPFFFLLSAHCFFDRDSDWQPVTSQATFRLGHEKVECRLVSALHRVPPFGVLDVLDLSVAACAAPLAGLASVTLSAQPSAANEFVAFAGFSQGLHVNMSAVVTTTEHETGKATAYARHMRISQLSSSLQLPGPPELKNVTAGRAAESAWASGGAGAAAAASAVPNLACSRGFFERRPEQGMSGGPVMDVRCGLLGIIELQLGQGGAFVQLTEPSVQRWVVDAMQQYRHKIF